MPTIDINEALNQQQQSLDAIAERLNPPPETSPDEEDE